MSTKVVPIMIPPRRPPSPRAPWLLRRLVEDASAAGAEEEDEVALADEAVVAAWAAASLPLLSLPRPGPAPVRWTMRLALSANSKELFKKESEYVVLKTGVKLKIACSPNLFTTID